MANTTVNIDIQVQTKSLNELEQELSQINAELKKVPVNSQEFKNLSKEAQGLTKQLNQAQKAAEGFTQEDKFRAADGSIKLLGGSLASVVGTLGVLGVESEAFGDFEKKAASAIAVAVGFKDIGEGISQVGPLLGKAGTAVKGFSITTKQALIATGVGAFVVVLGTVIAYWDDITSAVTKFGEKVPFVGKALDGIKSAFDSIYNAARPVLEFLGLVPTEAEAAEKALREAASASVGPMEQELALMKARKKSANEIFEQEKKILQARIDGAKDDEEAQKSRNELAILIAANTTRLAEEEEARNKEAAEKAKERLEQRKANEKEATDFLKSLKEEELNLLATTDEQKLELNRQRTLAEINELTVSEEQKNQIRLQAEQNYNIQLQQLKAQQDQENKEKEETRLRELNDFMAELRLDSIDNIFQLAREELDIQEQKDLEELNQLGATEDQKLKLAQFYSKKRKQIDEEEVEFRKGLQEEAFFATLAVASQVFGAIGDLANEGSKAAKIAAIAQATIDTLASAVAAYKSTVGIPIVGPVLAPIAAAAALAAGYATIRKIKNTPVPGGGGNQGGNVGSSSFGTPQLASQLSNQNIETRAPQQLTSQPTVRAYVLSGDVTSNQEADAKLNTKRTIV